MRGGAVAAGFATVALAAAAWAGAIEFGPVDKTLGDSPVALAVGAGDRVVAAVQATEPPVVGWIDTLDWRDESRQDDLGSKLETMRCIEQAGTSASPMLLVGGSSVGVINIDTSTTPATLGTESPFGLSGGTVADLAWDAAREVAYGADDAAGTIHWIPVTGASGTVDTEDGWPVALSGLTPTDLTLVDADTLLVVGDGGGSPMAALVDLAGDAPTWEELDLPVASGNAVAVDGDPDAARGWILLDDGTVIEVLGETTGDDDDSAGDDDDSAGDDDDSAGDDDDSAGDDDDSAGDDDDSAGDDDDSASAARADSWSTFVITTSGPTPATDLVFVGDSLYIVGGTQVDVVDPSDGATSNTFTLSGNGAAIAASTFADGHVYVALDELGQIAVLGDGPFVSITDVSTTELSSTSDSIDVTFTAGSTGDSGTCAYSVLLDGTVALDGTVLTPTGDATLGESTTITIEGSELSSGTHRLFVVCTTEAGGRGRASFGYYMGELAAPADFSVTPADSRVELSWTDANDENVDHYVVYFSDSEFGATDTPGGTTTDGNMSSGYTVELPTTLGDTVTSEITPLANDTTYWFAVAAVDADGGEGPRTDILSATPGATGGVAALTGDPGCTCNTSRNRTPAALLLLAFPLLALARRRPRSH